MKLLLYAAGSNAQGQLGIGTIEDSHGFSLAHEWGQVSDRSPPPKVIDFAAGANHTLLIIEEVSEGGLVGVRRLYAAGEGLKGQLGAQERDPTRFEMLDLASLIRGISGLDPCSELQPSSVAAAWDTSFVVLSSGSITSENDIVIAMGANDFGERTLASTVKVPNVIDFSGVLPAEAYDIGVDSIKSGPRHVLAVLSFLVDLGSWEGKRKSIVVGWGASRQCQLGLSPNNNSASSVRPRASPSTGRFQASPVVLPVEIPEGMTIRLAAGKEHSAILLVPSDTAPTSMSTLHLFGSDKRGQLCARKQSAILRGSDIGEGRGNIVDVSCCWNSTLVVTCLDGGRDIFAFGSNSHGQLALACALAPSSVGEYHPAPSHCALPFPVKSLFAGSEHALALLQGEKGDEVWGWGWNEHGNLGLDDKGTLEDVSRPRKVWSGEGQVVGAWAGCATSFVAVKGA